tara:strand:+ start:3691 stop:5997 length:2307 start_codon:yes stop_codon:yes gene_type:complete
MQELDKIGEDLFNKIRGRFPQITIGNENGEVINEPSQARFFDFEYQEGENKLGSVSVNISKDEGMTVIYSKDFITQEDKITKDNWYNFLKELRLFAKKRMLEFSIRDITKSNLTKRDYRFLSNNTGDNTMAESKLYGTSKISYQNIDSARLVIKHTESVDAERTNARTRNVGTIYIESSEGERFKYPYKHLNGARAMARHVAEGGNAYDDFGKHIVSLSEEMAKLNKFKRYMSRSSVMAESLADYTDAVNDRIVTVRKTLNNLQKKAFYTETFESFTPAVIEDVPNDIAENWIEQLTIKQFNEELKDIFPYVYKLVSEVTKAKEIGPDDVVAEDGCTPAHRKANKKKKTKEEVEIEDAFEGWMGQFGEDRVDEALPLIALVVAGARMALPALTRAGANIVVKGAKVAGAGAKGAAGIAVKNPMATGVGVGGAYLGKKAGDAIDAVGDIATDLKGDADALIAQASNGINAIKDQISAAIGNSGFLKVAQFASKYALPALAVVAILYGGKKIIDMLRGKGKEAEKLQTASIEQIEEAILHEAYINNAKDAIEVLGQLRGKGKQLERGQQEYKGNLPNEYVNDVWDVWTWMESKLGGGPEANDPKLKGIMDEVFRLRGEAKKMERIYRPDLEHSDEHMGAGVFANQIVNALYPLMQYIDMNEKKFEDDTMAVKIDKDGTMSKADGASEKQKTPLGEFILSYFDRETGEFPKGETAVLTMVEKDYGEQFIEPAKAFIEQINSTYEQFQMQAHPQQMEVGNEFDRMRELAGLR